MFIDFPDILYEQGYFRDRKGHFQDKHIFSKKELTSYKRIAYTIKMFYFFTFSNLIRIKMIKTEL